MKPTKIMSSKRKKKWGKKSAKRGEERKRKVKVNTAVSLLNPKTVEILLSAHARTSQADIMHLDQKAAKCTTCKPVCGKFYLFIARQWPENHSTSFKTRFSAKSPGANGLIEAAIKITRKLRTTSWENENKGFAEKLRSHSTDLNCLLRLTALLSPPPSSPGEGVLPYKKLMGMSRWMGSLGSHFHDWMDYNGVAFSIELPEWGRTFLDFLRVRQFSILRLANVPRSP